MLLTVRTQDGHHRGYPSPVPGGWFTLGEVGLAFVVPRAGAALAPRELIEWARHRMANYKVPRYVETCDALPANAVGKVLKDELRESWRARAGKEKLS